MIYRLLSLTLRQSRVTLTVFLTLLISGMIFVSRKGAFAQRLVEKTQRINIVHCTKVSIHPAFMQRRFSLAFYSKIQ
ncbi:hypothetical protein NOS3756_30100 [Nostoc sp. NIES-3756]|nr:hypothetical protein NOS3756_30100 [Nostoc sp. NIES-3756]BAY38217.1 hypothetical protein NIES2111_25620 [Nostoc sp. NIES-2111]